MVDIGRLNWRELNFALGALDGREVRCARFLVRQQRWLPVITHTHTHTHTTPTVTEKACVCVLCVSKNVAVMTAAAPPMLF